MIVLLRIPIESVVSGVIYNLETTVDNKPKKAPVKGAPTELRYDLAVKESAICMFLYSYLVYTYDWYKKEQKQEDKLKSLRSMWNNLVNLFKYFYTLKGVYRILMNNRIPTTLCWLYDIMFVMGIKYDPREVCQQERKIRKSIEEIISQMTTETAILSTTSVNLVTEEKFMMLIAYNPSIYDLIEKIDLNEEEKKVCLSEIDMLNLKIKKILPQFDKIFGKDSLFKGIKQVQGAQCYPYLRGFCFITMKAMLYELLEKMLSVTNKDKMSNVVFFNNSHIIFKVGYSVGKFIPDDCAPR